jgi:hypothetical protein
MKRDEATTLGVGPMKFSRGETNPEVLPREAATIEARRLGKVALNGRELPARVCQINSSTGKEP